MRIVTQAASASYCPAFPLLSAPKIAGLLPASVPPAYTVHRASSFEMPHIPTPEEIDFDIYTTLHRVFVRLMETSVPLSARPAQKIGAGS